MFEIMSFNVTLSVPFDWCMYDTFIEMFYCYVLKINNICTLLCKNVDHFWYICVPESKLGFFKNHRRIFTLKKKRILVKLSRQLQCATFNLTYFYCYSVFLMFRIQGPKSGFPTFWPRFAKQSDFSGSYVSQMGRGRFDDVMFSAENTFASVSALGTWVV